MGGSQLVLLLDAVMRLDRELTKLLGYTDVLATTIDAVELRPLRAHLAQAEAAMRCVRERLLGRARAATCELQETALRARMALVGELLQLPPARHLGNHVLDRIGRIHAEWLQERRSIIDAQLDSSAAERALARARDRAEHAFFAIGCDPELGQFVRSTSGTLAALFSPGDDRDVPTLPRLPRRAARGLR